MKLYYKSNNSATSPPLDLLNVQTGGKRMKKTLHPEASCARVQFLTPRNPLSNPLTPCSFQRFPRQQPGPGPPQLPTCTQRQLFPHPGSLSNFTTLLPPSLSFCLLFDKAAAGHHGPLKTLLGCCRQLNSFFPQAVSVLMQKGTQTDSKGCT